MAGVKVRNFRMTMFIIIADDIAITNFEKSTSDIVQQIKISYIFKR